jgi:hypothetical protein
MEQHHAAPPPLAPGRSLNPSPGDSPGLHEGNQAGAFGARRLFPQGPSAEHLHS